MTAFSGSSRESARRRAALVAGLAAVAAGALILRSVSIAEPLGIDQSLWASAVRGMSRGQLLYRDVWEQRPPGIYWAYLAAFQVFGWTPAAVALLDLCAAAATTALLYLIARPLAGPTTGALAAALYAALTMPAWLYRHSGFLERSVSETFIVVCAAAGFWCAVRFRAGGQDIFAFGVGVAAGAAMIFKPNAGLYLPAILLWTALYRTERSAARRPLVRLVALAAAGAAVMPALAIVWLWRLGTLGEAKIAVVDFNRFYVSQGFTLGGYALDFSKAVWLRMKTEPLWLAGGVGALVAIRDLARRRSLGPLAGLTVIWGAAAALVIVVNGARLFNSYFIQALAPLSLLAAWVLTESARASRPRRAIAVVTGVLMIVVLLQRHYPAKVFGSARADFDVLRGRADATAYLEGFGGYDNRRGYSARANSEVAAYVRDRTAPGDQIYLFGINGAGIYFAADRLTAHRFLRVNFFVPPEFPDPRFNLEAVTAELAAKRPRYIIFERLNSPSAMGKAVDSLTAHPAVVRLLEGYRPEASIEDFTLYRLAE